MSGNWYIWLILSGILIVAEMFTSGFVLLWFGVGALVAAILALTGLVSLPAQIVVFLAISVGLTIASRTIFERILPRFSPGRELKTGIDNLPGQIGMVVTSSAGASREGAVRVFGSTWRAYPAAGEDLLCEGEEVQVERVDGTSIYVRHVSGEPSWRQQDRLLDQ
jgi:membrane protein implicated in regulation of membrane protease activity